MLHNSFPIRDLLPSSAAKVTLGQFFCDDFSCMPSQLIKIAKTPALECSPPKSIYEASLSPSLLTLVVTSGVLTGCGHSGLPILFRGGPHLASNLVFLENYKISQETIAAYWRQTIILKDP